MLVALRISNIAVIEEAEVGFGTGLTVLTGETGAGKSILVDALGLLCGGRADADVLRAGAEEASLEGLFVSSALLRARLAELGLPDLGEEVSIRRVIQRNGRGKAYVNGSLVAVGVLSQLMRGVVDIAGQHEHTSLFDPRLHQSLLDRVGDCESLLQKYRTDHLALKAVDARIAALGGDEKQANSRAEFLRYQLEELDAFGPNPAEDAQLEELKRRLMSTERLRRTCAEVEALIHGEEGGANELLGRALHGLSEAAKWDAGLMPMVASVTAALAEADEVSRALARYSAGLEADPGRLAEVDERLDTLKRLCKKHGVDLQGLVNCRAELAAELSMLENRQGQLEAFLKDREEALQLVLRSGEALSKVRREAATVLSRKVREGLALLAMGKSEFEVKIASSAELRPQGLDDVEFFFTANPGEPARPLAKVASGGEASRVLLAMKRAFAREDEGACYVLDEADAGVGGAVAEVVGRMMKEVSAHRQVLCITHLPQVAAFADSHLVIEKAQSHGRTSSKVVPLKSGDERTQELARMLSGVKVSREAMGAAQALVRSAQRACRKPPLRDRKPSATGRELLEAGTF